MEETSGAKEDGMEIETYVNSNTFLADNEVSTDHTKTSQTMDVEMEIESSFKVNALLADNKVSTETEEIMNRLPLDLQSYIVILLPIDDAVRTSILSKKFKSIWHSLPCLMFDYENFPKVEGKEVIFEEFINRTLLQHDESSVVLLDLNLGCGEETHPLINVEWIKFGLDHLLRHLMLDGVMKDHRRLPNSLFTSISLVTLDLSILGYVLTWPTNVFLPNLTELKMCGLFFLEENIVFDLSKTCPSLKELAFSACIFANVKLVYISGSMGRLVLRHCVIYTCKVKLRTPALKYFEYDNALASGFDFEGLCPKFSSFINVHETNHLGRPEGDIARCAVNLYTELRNASFMFTRHWFIQYLIQGEAFLLNMKPVLFNYLTSLNVSTLATVEQYKMLIFILSRCPKLAALEIKFVSVFEILALDDVEFNWKDMLHYEIFASLYHLEVGNLEGSIGQMGLVEFLLLKACEVGNINISPPKTIDNLGNSIITISRESWSAITARVLKFKRASRAHISYEYK